MPRLARHAFTALSALSLVLCVAACVLWVRSYFVSDRLKWGNVVRVDRKVNESEMVSNRGRVTLISDSRRFHDTEGFDLYLMDIRLQGLIGDRWLIRSAEEPFSRTPADDVYLDWLGFRVSGQSTTRGTPGARRSLTFKWHMFEGPYWLAALLLSAPLLHKVKIRLPRRNRRPANQCAQCGYDLRASPERCPECGAANPAAVSLEI